MEAPLPAVPPVMEPETVGAAQANVLLTMEDVKAMFVAVPLQMDCDDGVAVSTGSGFTIIVIVLEVAAVRHGYEGVMITFTVLPLANVEVVNVALVAPLTVALFICHWYEGVPP